MIWTRGSTVIISCNTIPFKYRRHYQCERCFAAVTSGALYSLFILMFVSRKKSFEATLRRIHRILLSVASKLEGSSSRSCARRFLLRCLRRLIYWTKSKPDTKFGDEVGCEQGHARGNHELLARISHKLHDINKELDIARVWLSLIFGTTFHILHTFTASYSPETKSLL